MNKARLLKLEFVIEARADYSVENFIGNKLRGALGEAMVRLFCIHGNPNCKECEKKRSCIYSEVFKPINEHSEFTTSPAPFSIKVSKLNKKMIKKGQALSFYITLFGDRVRYWKDLAEAVVDIFGDKKRSFNNSFQLLEIKSALEGKTLWKENEMLESPMAALWTDEREEMPEANSEADLAVLIEFHSALIMKGTEEKELDFPSFIDAVFYRLGSIIDLYEEKELILPYGLLCRKPYITCEYLKKGDKPKVIFKGKLKRYLAYIDIGAHLQIGKKTTYGFGEYSYHFIEE